MMKAQAELAKVEESVVEVEQEESDIANEIAILEETSRKMLKREMDALGVVNDLDVGQEIALADPSIVGHGFPGVEQVDWDATLAWGGEGESIDWGTVLAVGGDAS
jgi:hypothetical protein